MEGKGFFDGLDVSLPSALGSLLSSIITEESITVTIGPQWHCVVP
jgi:hypothetical protein